MDDLTRKARRSRLFRDLEDVPNEVRLLVDKLVNAGRLGKRKEPRDRGGQEHYLWPKEIKTRGKIVRKYLRGVVG